MKLKKLAITCVGVAFSLTLFAGNSFAAKQWAACDAQQIGPYGDIVRVKVINCNKNPAGTKKGWMTLSSKGTDQMMATILTAMSLDKPIAVEYDDTNSVTDSQGHNIASAIILNINSQ